jgi:DNA-binding PucR family transcriptional regulator
MTNRQEAMFMFITLAGEALKWSYMLKGITNQEAKQALNQLHVAETRLLKVLKKELGADFFEEVENQGEVFSMILQKIKELDTPEKKQELFNLLNAYANNELTIINN